MSDTPPKVQRIYQEMLLARSGPERLRMGCDLFSTSRKLVIAVLGYRNLEKIREHLFLHFSGSEFTPAERSLILSAIRACNTRI
jgi:hypothetical protein